MSLIYHDVADSGGSPRFRIAPALFRAHLAAVAATGATPSLLGDATSDGAVRLTFDDGDASAATTVAPALAEYGWKAHFFIITDRIGARGSLGADELRELASAGHAISSHGATHTPLAHLAPDALADELRRSKAALEDILAAPVSTLSAPRGVWSPAVARAAAAAGYTDFFVSDPRTKPSVVEDIRVHGRFSVIADTTPERIAALCRLSRAAIWREVAFWRARTAGKRALGPIYARRRSRILGRRHT